MAQAPEGTAAPAGVPQPTPEMPFAFGIVFQPTPRELIEGYLIPKALGRFPDDPIMQASVPNDVDVYAVRPEALPFPPRHRAVHDHVWAYFFTKRPAGGSGAEGSSKDDVREVAAGGYWRRYGRDKRVVGNGGEVRAFRRRFAFHEPGPRGKTTEWRVEEFRVKETAPSFRGEVFHPDAKGMVIWKVYNEVIPKEEPAVDYYSVDEDEEEEEIEPVVITVCTPTP